MKVNLNDLYFWLYFYTCTVLYSELELIELTLKMCFLMCPADFIFLCNFNLIVYWSFYLLIMTKTLKKVIRALELRLRKITTSWSFILQSVTMQLIWFIRPLISKWSHLILCPVVLTLSAVWHGVILARALKSTCKKVLRCLLVKCI